MNDAAGKQRQAVSLTNKRLEAYLHRASQAAGKVRTPARTEVPLIPAEEEFCARHSFADELRRRLLQHIQKGDVSV